MRLWSIHPKYLDSKGLVALWRESLLAQKVLEGKTKGYINHPQLYRFKQSLNPIHHLGCFLSHIYEEAIYRGYNFDKSKILHFSLETRYLTVTKGQIEFETNHLLKKLEIRSIEKYNVLKKLTIVDSHPIFKVIAGNKEHWEK